MKKAKPAITMPAMTMDAIYFKEGGEPQHNIQNDHLTPESTPLRTSNLATEHTRTDIMPQNTVEKIKKLLLSAPTNNVDREIYMPIPTSTTKFMGTNNEQISGNSLPFPVQIFKKLLKMFYIRVYQDKLYVFNSKKGGYEYYSDDDFDTYIINANFGETINYCGNSRTYDEIKKLIRKEHTINVREDIAFSTSYWAFQNGVLYLPTKTIFQNDGKLFIRHVLKCNYNPSALCPQFEKFLTAVAGGDRNIYTLLWEVIGYLLSHDMNAKCFFLFLGVKDSGKSLLGTVMESLIGEEWVANVSPSDFNGRFASASLKDKVLNMCMDLPDYQLSAEAVRTIKAITGLDKLYIEEKFQPGTTMKPKVRLLFGSNHMIKSEDSAFMDRMVIVPFQYQVPKNQQITGLKDILSQEKDGITIKALHSYEKLVSHNYIFTKYNNSNSYYKYVDPNEVIRLFAEECCEFTDSEGDKLFSSELYDRYNDYCHLNKLNPIKQNNFSEIFGDLFSDKSGKKKIRKGIKCANGFTHIKIKNPSYSN